MGKVSRAILIIVLFVIFFEVGLFSSYTIVTSEPPDIQGLIDMQVQEVISVINPNTVNEVLIKDPTDLNISNKQSVATALENLSKVDGVNLDNLNATTYDDTDNDNLNVTIEALGYASPNSTSTQIVISQEPSYKIVATGFGNMSSGKVVIDTDSIKIESILKLY